VVIRPFCQQVGGELANSRTNRHIEYAESQNRVLARDQKKGPPYGEPFFLVGKDRMTWNQIKEELLNFSHLLEAIGTSL